VLAKDKYGQTPLHLALSRGYVDFARFVVEHGADVSVETEYWGTPLHLASSNSSYGHVDLARILIEHGADLSAKDEDDPGLTPLRHALSAGHGDLAQFLVEHSADSAA